MAKTRSVGRGRTADFDHQVGARVRERRIMLGLTQQQLAEMIGVTYQQAHKYERGVNRVSAGRLFEIAHVLKVPVSFFYESIKLDTPLADGVMPRRERMMLEIARNFSLITNEEHQQAVAHLVRALATSGESAD
jgi:transcriptional regulator with XRE-family HTH domain